MKFFALNSIVMYCLLMWQGPCASMCLYFLSTAVSPDSVDLLKSAASDINNGVFKFDGKSVAHDVTDDVSFGAEALSSRFMFATWMKHDQEDDEQVKQHVVCSADAEGECL